MGKSDKETTTFKKTRQGQKITAFTITTPLPPEYNGLKYAGEIHVQYLDGPPEDSVYEGVTSILNTHSGVRSFPNEHGHMAAAGLRMDLVPSTLTHYTPKEGNKSQGMSVQK